jgi:predicted nucleic-acid-binding Zn-ribbon protein
MASLRKTAAGDLSKQSEEAMAACAKCGSAILIHSAQVVPFHGRHGSRQELQVQVEKDPAAMFMKEAVRSSIKTVICGSCGFVEFYVTNPGELAAAEAERNKGK